jgi:DNA-binding protein HU-beta
MNKSELIAAVAQSAGLTKKDTERAINAALDAITASLRSGEKVQISGFGTFEVKEREARIGRNPHTKEAIDIPATRVPSFKASKALKDNVAL